MPVLPHVLAASATGPSHRREGADCQDAFAFRACGSTVAAAVADGLGSARCGAIGAAIAVEAALEACLQERSAAAGIVAGRVAVEAAAWRLAQPLGDFACTLLVCLAAGDEVTAGHVGDGAAVVERDGRFDVLSRPGDSEYPDEVVPLTSAGWRDETRVSRARADAFALLTDGCQRAALRRGEAHAGWWAPIFAHARRAGDPGPLQRLLASERLDEHSDDDKTLLVAVLR